MSTRSNPLKIVVFFIKKYQLFSNGEIINECKDVLDILNKFKKEKLFYKILIKLFNDDCASYYKLYKNIIINNKYKIIYGKKIINRQYKNDFIFLLKLRSLYIFSYTFLNN